MKKLFFTLAAVFIAFGTAGAQEYSDSIASKRVIWGVKANIGAEIPGKVKQGKEGFKVYNSGFSGSVGGLANIALGKNFYFEPELSLYYEEYSYNNIEAVAPNSPSVNIGPTLHKLGVRIPLDFGYFFDISEKWGLAVYTGPQFDYIFYGNAKYDKSDEAISQSIKESGLDKIFSGPYAQNRFNVDWKVGVGCPVEHFLISIEADFGLTNTMKSPWTMRENRLTLGIGYYF